MRAILFVLICLVASTANAVEYLEQSTAVNVQFGPLVDSINGVDPETGLTISQADIRLSKNGGDFAQTNNSAGATHDEAGYYIIPLDETDTSELGRLRIAVSEAGAAPIRQDYLVVPSNVYDSLVNGSDQLIVDGAAVVTDLLSTARVGSPTAGTYGELFDWLMNTFASDGVFAEAALAEAPTGSGSGLTAQQTRDAMKLAPTAGAAAAGSVDDLLAGIEEDTGVIGTPANGTVSTDLAAIDTAVDGLVSGSTIIPVNQSPVAPSRTWKIQRKQNALVGDRTIGTTVGESPLYAVDFFNDLPTNGRLADFTSIAIATGTAGGVTFDTDNLGIDKSQAKVKITAVTAGTYELLVTCTYQSAFGNGTVKATVTLEVN